MNSDLIAVLWVIGAFVAAILLANRPLTFGAILSIPWFWLAWCAAEQGAAFGSCVMFLDGVALLCLCVSMHWRSGDYRARATR